MAMRRWRTETTVNTTTAGNQVHSDVTALNDGGYVIVWADANTSQIRGKVFNADGSARTAELLLIAGTSFEPDVTADAAGGFWVGHTRNLLSSDNASVTGFNQFGGGAITVSLAATSDGEDQVAVASRPGGGFWAAYHNVDSTNGDIFLTRYDGATVTNFGTLLGLGNQFNPDIEVLSNGNIAVAMNDIYNSEIRIALYTPSGSLIDYIPASVFQVDTDALPKITALQGGRFVVVYGSFGDSFDPGRGVAGTLFNANGIVLKYFNLHSLTDGGQFYPEVIGTNDGGFVAVWATTVDGGASNQIRGQAFNALGERSGGEFIVSSLPLYATLAPLNLSLALLGDGRIVVTWDGFYDPGDGSDSSGTAIHSQIIDPRDGIVNGTSAGETLFGHPTAGDEISGFAGADALYGLGGNDDLRGGNGNDTLSGGKGTTMAMAATPPTRSLAIRATTTSSARMATMCCAAVSVPISSMAAPATTRQAMPTQPPA